MSEPAELKLFEHALYVGAILSAIAYGINLTVYSMIVKKLLSARKMERTSMHYFHAAFSTILILLMTVTLSTGSVWGEEMWISARDRPGGVLLFLIGQTDVWYEVLGRASTFVMIFVADLFLIYRLHVIYARSYIVIVLPLLANLAAFALAIVQLVMMQDQKLNFYDDGKLINIGTPYYSLTLSVNIIVTLLIVYRLHRLRKEVAVAIGSENARVYSNISTIIIESAAPYTITGIAWIIPYARGNSLAVCIGTLADELACLSPLLITLRILHRKGWSHELVSHTQPQAMRHGSGTELGAIEEHHLPALGKMDSRGLEPMSFKSCASSDKGSV